MLGKVRWGKFKLGDLFDIKNTNSFNTDSLVDGNKYDYVTRTSLNNGVLQETGFINNENLNETGIWSLGLLQMDFFYRKREWYAGQFVRKIIPKIKLTDKSVLYFTTVLNSIKNKLLSVLVRYVDEEFKNSVVELPITNENTIDFDFMDTLISELEFNHISELEFNHISELEAYLLVTGLKDYKLNKEERNAIESFDIDGISWKRFNLEGLFGKSSRGKRLKSDDRNIGTLPFVTAGEGFEGVSAYISNDVDIYSSNTITIDMFGSAKYRNYKYGCDDHVAVVHTENINKYATIFITSAIHKSSHNGQFNYGKNFYASDADELDIMLPIDDKGNIDYDFMKHLISAVQKLVIKDVVLYSDEKIKTTKQVVNNKVKGNKIIKDTIFDKKLAAHIDVNRLIDKLDSNKGS